MDYFGFIIDTDAYSGNFEREMCAYLTGIVGECGVGEEYVDPAIAAQFENALYFRSDEGCNRPVEIYPTPGYFNTGLGIHYRPGQEAQALAAHCLAVKNEETKKIDRFKILQQNPVRSGWTIESLDLEIKRSQDRIEEAAALTTPQRYPAYQSVCIYFYNEPTKKQIDFLKKRAFEFRAFYVKKRSYNKSFMIIGFRLLCSKTTEDIIEL